ncbi:MAG: hypothetical protein ABH858_02640, partial [Candidatus Omnitrophota bacterium]
MKVYNRTGELVYGILKKFNFAALGEKFGPWLRIEGKTITKDNLMDVRVAAGKRQRYYLGNNAPPKVIIWTDDTKMPYIAASHVEEEQFNLNIPVFLLRKKKTRGRAVPRCSLRDFFARLSTKEDRREKEISEHLLRKLPMLFPMQAWEENYTKALDHSFYTKEAGFFNLGQKGDVEARQKALTRGYLLIIDVDGALLWEGKWQKTLRGMLHKYFQDHGILIVEGRFLSEDNRIRFLSEYYYHYQGNPNDPVRLFLTPKKDILSKRPFFVRAVSRCNFDGGNPEVKLPLERYTDGGEFYDTLSRRYRSELRWWRGFLIGQKTNKEMTLPVQIQLYHTPFYTPFKAAALFQWLDNGWPIRLMRIKRGQRAYSIDISWDNFIRLEYKTRGGYEWKVLRTLSREQNDVADVYRTRLAQELLKVEGESLRVRFIPVHITKYGKGRIKRTINFCGQHPVPDDFSKGALLAIVFAHQDGQFVKENIKARSAPDRSRGEFIQKDREYLIRVYDRNGRLVKSTGKYIGDLYELFKVFGPCLRIEGKIVSDKKHLGFTIKGRIVRYDLGALAPDKVMIWTDEHGMPYIAIDQARDAVGIDMPVFFLAQDQNVEEINEEQQDILLPVKVCSLDLLMKWSVIQIGENRALLKAVGKLVAQEEQESEKAKTKEKELRRLFKAITKASCREGLDKIKPKVALGAAQEWKLSLAKRVRKLALDEEARGIRSRRKINVPKSLKMIREAKTANTLPEEAEAQPAVTVHIAKEEIDSAIKNCIVRPDGENTGKVTADESARALAVLRDLFYWFFYRGEVLTISALELNSTVVKEHGEAIYRRLFGKSWQELVRVPTFYHYFKRVLGIPNNHSANGGANGRGRGGKRAANDLVAIFNGNNFADNPFDHDASSSLHTRDYRREARDRIYKYELCAVVCRLVGTSISINGPPAAFGGSPFLSINSSNNLQGFILRIISFSMPRRRTPAADGSLLVFNPTFYPARYISSSLRAISKEDEALLDDLKEMGLNRSFDKSITLEMILEKHQSVLDRVIALSKEGLYEQALDLCDRLRFEGDTGLHHLFCFCGL